MLIIEHFWNEDDWFLFLSHMVREEDVSAKELLYMIEKPWKWETEYRQFQEISPDCE